MERKEYIMTGYEFINYLEEKSFEVDRWNVDNFYKRLENPELRRRTFPIKISVDLAHTRKPYLNDEAEYEVNYFPGIISVYIDREENIRVDCFAGYYNSAYNEYCRYHRHYDQRTYDEAVKIIDHLTTSNPITEKMCKTILYDYQALKYSKNVLEYMRLNKVEYKDKDNGLDKFLEDCGFNSFEEYKEYIDSLK